MANTRIPQLPVAIPGITADTLFEAAVPDGLGGWVSRRCTASQIALSVAAFTLTTLGNSGPATYDIGTGVLNIPVYAGSASTQQIITAPGAVSVAVTDSLIAINKGAPSATTINLPPVASRGGDANSSGTPLQITDFAGNGGDITIVPDGAETIMGLSQAIIGSYGPGVGGAAALTLIPSIALGGWYVA